MDEHRDRKKVQLTDAECAFCEFCHATIAEHHRATLRAEYSLARRFQMLKAVPDEPPRALERCAERMGVNRSTLFRYSLLAHFKPHDFELVVAVRDVRGYPPTLSDLRAVAKLPPERRVETIVARMATRDAKEQARRDNGILK